MMRVSDDPGLRVRYQNASMHGVRTCVQNRIQFMRVPPRVLDELFIVLQR